MGPPYLPPTASVGGVPTVKLDVPICAVFMFLYLTGAAGHMTILQINMRRGHKFIISGLMFGFCMARIVTCTMRIVWATRPTNIRIAIAAMVFVAAGVLLLYIINLVFAQRICRAAHPNFGWHKAVSMLFRVLYGLIVVVLAIVITAVVQSFYTLNPNTHRIDRDLLFFGQSYLLLFAFLPLPLVLFTLVIPRKTRVEKFGSGRWRSKIWILLASAALLCLGAAFRAGTNYKNPRPKTDPAWYDAKWCFYVFNFTIEIIVVYMYLILRVDRRFHIPDGAHGPGSYTVSKSEHETVGDTRPSFGSGTRIMSEEEVFDDKSPAESPVLKDEELAGQLHK